MSPSSPIADHCSTYALRDPKEAKFSSPCDHTHEQACPQCDALENALQKTQDLISVDHAVLDDDELVDLQYTSKQAAQDILAWKAYQLRSTRQDTARVDSTNRLDSSSILTKRLGHEIPPSKVQRVADKLVREERNFMAY